MNEQPGPSPMPMPKPKPSPVPTGPPKITGRIPHGTYRGYNKYACRCQECRRANTEVRLSARRRKATQPVPAHLPHGSRSTYVEYGCRCRPCTAAHSAYCAEYRRRRKFSAPDFPRARIHPLALVGG